MSYCINPKCPQPNDPANINNRICRNCGSELLLQGRYQVMRLLSDSSGFGKVYEAYKGAIPKILKVLKQKHNDKPKIIELFRQEAMVLSQLNHPGIPRVEPDGYFQFFPKNSTEPVHCIIMEKIDGLNLKQWMNQQGNHPISEKQALNWLKQLAEILHLVHQKNYFHRDIKPENIMIRSNGRLVLIDFGTARELTFTYLADVGGAGSVTKISSTGYTPPEQEKGHAVPQSDFYALGRTFVYLLTGKQATDPQIYDPLNDTCNWRQLAPHISEPLANFVDKLMAPTAAKRHKNTQEILDELTNLSQEINSPQLVTNLQKQTSIQIPPDSSTATKTFNTIPKKWIIAGIATLTVICGGYAIRLYQHPNPQSVQFQNLSFVKPLQGHLSYINSLTFNHEGNKLFSSSADKTIKIWDIDTGKFIQNFNGHDSSVNYLVLSPDGQKLYSASADKTIKVWDIDTGKEIQTLKGHTSSVNYLVLSPDGQNLFSASADKTIKIWDIATGKVIRPLAGHTSFVNSLAISPDGQKLYSASADKTIKVWDIPTGKELDTLRGHTSSVNYLTISPDGQKLYSASADKTIKVWDIATGQEIKQLKDSSFVNFLVINPDGQTLMSSNADKEIKVWNLSTGQVIHTFTGPSQPINYFAISSDWQTIATGTSDKIIKIWRVPKSD
ncbi:MAG: serine/threonine-protein kinase [Cyanobacteriota bacterium]